jgi:DNA/RNA endonuclease G (NUC1)
MGKLLPSRCVPWSALVLISLFASEAAAQYCDCDISERRRNAYNALLQLDSAEIAETDGLHLPRGVPSRPTGATNEIALHQDDYVMNYDEDLKVATWAAYRLRGVDVAASRERKQCFRRDPRISDDDDASFCEDYDEPVFDRGHIVPDADMSHCEAAQLNTYIFTNMAPQHKQFNQILWNRLERYVREWAITKEVVYVVTGAIFDENGDNQRDDDNDAVRMESDNGNERVAIPTHFFKIVMHELPDESIESLALILPHNNDRHVGSEAHDYLTSRLTTIDAIEEVTGVNFFRDLPNAEESAVEQFQATQLWPRN